MNIWKNSFFNLNLLRNRANLYALALPTPAFTALSWELAGLVHGTATLTIHIRDGRLARFTTGRERSHTADGNDE